MSMMCFRAILLAVLAVADQAGNAQTFPRGATANLQKLEFTVDGVAREAMVFVPESATAQPTPLVFVFHGHGGSARQVSRSIEMWRHWPEAISVYMQGLETPGLLTDPQGRKAGWQARAGGQGDRDLRFFDAVLAKLKADYRVDDKRIYATGHSNGGGFTYLLWAERGDVFAAVAPSAAVAVYVDKLKPKPVMHLAGKKDALVKFAWQQRMMDAVRDLNGCAREGKTWDKDCMLYPSSGGNPLVSYIHSGGHEFVRTATPLIVKFFKEHPADRL
jgi:polyhydroxybutyrate depolymerase